MTKRLVLVATAWGAPLAVAGAVIVFVIGPATGHWRLLPILSGSMSPRLGVGALAVATPEPPRSVRAGQVIVYRIPVGSHRTIAHRVLEVVRGGPEPIVRTKGDANRTADPWQARLTGSTLWVVRGSVPLLGYPTIALHNGRLLIASLLAGALALWLARLCWYRRPPQARARPAGGATDPL